MLYQLSLPEGATEDLETLLARELRLQAITCPAHPGTTLDGTSCEVCVLNELDDIAVRMAELEAEAGQNTTAYVRLEERSWELEESLPSAPPVVSPWAARNLSGTQHAHPTVR